VSVRRPRPPAPFWFHALIALVWALAARALTPASTDPLAPSLAFWGIFLAIGELIWQGIHTVGDATVAALVFTVRQLWQFATTIYDGARHVADAIRIGLYKAWDFTKGLYEDILKPAWQKFWSLVDRVRGALEHALAPVIKFLRQIRDDIIGFYTKWVRPIIDTIETTRKILRVLAALHLDFARKLDVKLGELEELIDRPFRILLEKVNEILNLVNRVVTANGLFQRLALVRSIERDMVFIHREFVNMRSNPLDDVDLKRLRDKNKPPTPREIFDHLKTLSPSDGLVDPDVDARLTAWQASAATDTARSL
jgi:predicted house-cleaning noncanonical NTP pyrophosphatase (MazG superfamily)